jgi:hypothetical protein
MTTKPLLLLLLAVFLSPHAILAEIQGHSPPYVAVGNASDIAVGMVQVSRANGLQVRFTPQTVLKGNMQPGGTYIVEYTTDHFRLNYPDVMPQIAAAAEGKPAVMFLGRLQPDGRTLTPDSLEGAVWPRNTQDVRHQTPDTLEECITFVKALLANPKLKLKNVNGRRVLPDSYTLPPAPLEAPPLSDQMRYVTVFSPSRAVKHAEDIAVGMVQVFRTNGLEVRFTPQTVLKGGMQPAKTYVIRYPHDYPSLREFLDQIAIDAEGKSPVMFLGRLWGDGKMLEPNSRDGAVWPRSSKWGGVFQTPDTLEECVTFVKALLANPNLKLKIVNDRQMLPDDYTPPPAGTPKAP